jgi:RHS repeat-associated protein
VGTWLTDTQGGYTDLGYTGQRNYAYINLLDYGARWYSAALGRFIQPDSIVPDLTDTQAWNRFSYVNNNPVKYNDPTGHLLEDSGILPDGDGNIYEERENYNSFTDWEYEYGRYLANAAMNMYRNRDDYYIWGYVDGAETVGYPPPFDRLPSGTDYDWYVTNEDGVFYTPSLQRTLNGRIPAVCADVPINAYNSLGIDLTGGAGTTYSDWLNGTYFPQYRNVEPLEDAATSTKTWGSAGVEVGETVVTSGHAALVVNVTDTGYDPSNIWVVTTSGTDNTISMMTLATMLERLGTNVNDENLAFLKMTP